MMENNNNSKDRQAISSYYNEFKKKQVAIGLNLRHYVVFEKCMKAGLKKNHHVLEIGCGIGTFTTLLSRYIKDGAIVATDISNESIELAKKSIKSPIKVDFQVSDMTDFTSDIKFDFVVMVDVLEHIPIEQYDQLFGIINANTHDNSILAINIPHPDAIRFIRKNNPENLQIIDNSVEMDFLSAYVYKNGLRLTGYKTYSIYNKIDDFVFMTFEKSNKNKVLTNKSMLRIKSGKLFFKIKYLISLVFGK